MAITTLDAKSALIVVDLQKGFAAVPTAHPMSEVVSNAGILAETFRRNDLPVVLVNVAGGAPGRTDESHGLGNFPADWMDFVPELKQRPDDHVVTKRTWGAFTNTDLEAHLRSRGVTQVIVTGIATTAGVESTARHAHELGFNVTLAVDAMTDRRLDAHTNSITRIFPRIGETTTTREIVDFVERRSA